MGYQMGRVPLCIWLHNIWMFSRFIWVIFRYDNWKKRIKKKKKRITLVGLLISYSLVSMFQLWILTMICIVKARKTVSHLRWFICFHKCNAECKTSHSANMFRLTKLKWNQTYSLQTLVACHCFQSSTILRLDVVYYIKLLNLELLNESLLITDGECSCYWCECALSKGRSVLLCFVNMVELSHLKWPGILW